MPYSKTDEVALKNRERRARALELRRGGMTYQQIADTLGYYNRQKAHDAVKLVLNEMVEEPAQMVRVFELSRLDRLLRAHWLDALKDRPCRRCGGAGEVIDKGKVRQCQACKGRGSTDRKIQATKTVLSILDRIHRLKGLDEGIPMGEDGEVVLAIRRETSWRTPEGQDGVPAGTEVRQVEEIAKLRRPAGGNGRNGGNGESEDPS